MSRGEAPDDVNVIVVVLTGGPEGVGVGDGELGLLLPPPQAMASAASPMATAPRTATETG